MSYPSQYPNDLTYPSRYTKTTQNPEDYKCKGDDFEWFWCIEMNTTIFPNPYSQNIFDN